MDIQEIIVQTQRESETVSTESWCGNTETESLRPAGQWGILVTFVFNQLLASLAKRYVYGEHHPSSTGVIIESNVKCSGKKSAFKVWQKMANGLMIVPMR